MSRTHALTTTDDRTLVWDGCLNVRDLGGIRTTDGGRTAHRAIVRADNLDRLTAEGWDTLLDHGIRTVVDLRNIEEYKPLLPLPEGVELIRVPLDELAGPAWWETYGRLDGTPLALRPYLDHCAHAAAELVTTIAGARPGGLVVHCGAGRDRTGLAALLLLALAGAEPSEIVADYLLSAPNVRPLYGMLGLPDQHLRIDAVLSEAGTTAEAALYATLDGFDPAGYLLAAGVDPADLAAVRARLLDA
ncbi:tyrosine-protein phosphatase [Streptomyces sp. CB01881]|uniref:tyrosine-protein phosphatase n=1 Tax=Streptomyces sp. CB01881 TaxID=2078691 RepID=UPI000CDC04A5|nr:tyrosine-protein phosphatase [Streptomyces sp. CB01881]AUY51049.1 protein-tyrosine-phosphatase [Streptomyces sp. CB01881]TYC74434.1 tyrosine-protein phosphatase [Streptomyces sp. CB01881]